MRTQAKALLAFGLLQTSAVIVQTKGDETSTYGIDMSFPSTGTTIVSTNYPWLPHNVDPENNPTPSEYEGMPIQPLGDRMTAYQNYMQGCRDYWNEILEEESENERFELCDRFEIERIHHNIDQPTSMMNFTDLGFKKMKAPKDLYDALLQFWKDNRDSESDEEWAKGNIFVNYWENPSKMIDVKDAELIGGGPSLRDQITNVTSKIISEWTGQTLVSSSVYGIRVYKEGAILVPHVDRLPLISSAIINVDQDVDEEWPLEVIGHDGIARNVTMEPGDMILYESHSVMHSRPFAMKGRYFANIFIHFMPVPSEEQIKEHSLPPYIKPGSLLAGQWLDGDFGGDIPGAPRREEETWGQNEAHDAAGDGDLDTLIDIAKNDMHLLHEKDYNGWEPIHEAVRTGRKDVVEFLKDQGANLNAIAEHRRSGRSVLDIAIDEWDEEDPTFIDWLISIGATLTKYELGPDL